MKTSHNGVALDMLIVAAVTLLAALGVASMTVWALVIGSVSGARIGGIGNGGNGNGNGASSGGGLAKTSGAALLVLGIVTLLSHRRA
jgi:hypothetical protein